MSAYRIYRNPKSDGIIESIVFLLFLIGLVCYGLYLGATALWGYDYEFCGTTVDYPELYDPNRGSAYVIINLVEYPDTRFTASKEYVHIEPGTVIHFKVRYLGREIPGRLHVEKINFVESCDSIPTNHLVNTLILGGKVNPYRDFVFWYVRHYPLIVAILWILFGTSLFLWAKKVTRRTNNFVAKAVECQFLKEISRGNIPTQSIPITYQKEILQRYWVSYIMKLLAGMSVGWGIMLLIGFFK